MREDEALIREHPLIPGHLISAASRPVAGEPGEAPLRTLRRNGLCPPGLALRPRAGGGRLVGQVRVYSALVRDAARMSRLGLDVEADAAGALAAQLEGTQAATAIAERLAGLPADPAAADGWEVYTAAIDADAELARLVGDFSRMTTAARDRLMLPAICQVLGGRVSGLERRTARIECPAWPVTLSRRALADIGCDFEGAPVVVLIEDHGPQLLITVEPGLLVIDAAGLDADAPEPRTRPDAGGVGGGEVITLSGQARWTSSNWQQGAHIDYEEDDEELHAPWRRAPRDEERRESRRRPPRPHRVRFTGTVGDGQGGTEYPPQVVNAVRERYPLCRSMSEKRALAEELGLTVQQLYNLASRIGATHPDAGATGGVWTAGDLHGPRSGTGQVVVSGGMNLVPQPPDDLVGRVQRIDLRHYFSEHLDLAPLSADDPGDVFASQGHGRLSCRCPFHEEATPSCVLYEPKHGQPWRWHCFGTCDAGGTVIDAAMRAHDFTEAADAIAYLAELYGLDNGEGAFVAVR